MCKWHCVCVMCGVVAYLYWYDVWANLNGSLLCILVHGKNRRPKVELIIWLALPAKG